MPGSLRLVRQGCMELAIDKAAGTLRTGVCWRACPSCNCLLIGLFFFSILVGAPLASTSCGGLPQMIKTHAPLSGSKPANTMNLTWPAVAWHCTKPEVYAPETLPAPFPRHCPLWLLPKASKDCNVDVKMCENYRKDLQEFATDPQQKQWRSLDTSFWDDVWRTTDRWIWRLTLIADQTIEWVNICPCTISWFIVVLPVCWLRHECLPPAQLTCWVGWGRCAMLSFYSGLANWVCLKPMAYPWLQIKTFKLLTHLTHVWCFQHGGVRTQNCTCRSQPHCCHKESCFRRTNRSLFVKRVMTIYQDFQKLIWVHTW